MKKSILLVAAGLVLCAVAFTGYKVYENSQTSKFSDLMIKNLEALADEEEADVECVYSPGDKCTVKTTMTGGPDGDWILTDEIDNYKKKE